MKSFQLNN